MRSHVKINEKFMIQKMKVTLFSFYMIIPQQPYTRSIKIKILLKYSLIAVSSHTDSTLALHCSPSESEQNM